MPTAPRILASRLTRNLAIVGSCESRNTQITAGQNA